MWTLPEPNLIPRPSSLFCAASDGHAGNEASADTAKTRGGVLISFISFYWQSYLINS